MVTVKIGNLFESKAQTLVNTVNCVGIMGKGVALEFRNRFPDMYEDYVRRCKTREVKLGHPYLFRGLLLPWILNFPTKDHWRSVSRLEDIVAGLRHLKAHYKEWGIVSLAAPPLGCGQGQLEWRVVGPTLYRHFKQLEIPVELYAPFGTPHEELQPDFLGEIPVGKVASESSDKYHLAPAWITLVEILSRIETEPYHWPVGRTTFQKIAYFATEAGIPTGLHYQRGSFGPYAVDLKQRITALVNNGLIQEKRIGRMFAVRTGPTFPDARRAYESDLNRWQSIIEKVSDLFMRLNTDQAELTATVHFAAKEAAGKAGAVPSEKDILQAVMNWKLRRRPPLEQKQVALTVRHMNMLNWIGARVSEDLPFKEEEVFHV